MRKFGIGLFEDICLVILDNGIELAIRIFGYESNGVFCYNAKDGIILYIFIVGEGNDLIDDFTKLIFLDELNINQIIKFIPLVKDAE